MKKLYLMLCSFASIFVGFRQIETTQKTFVRLFSFVCFIIDFALFISILLIIGGVPSSEDSNFKLILIAGWFAAFLFLTVTMGIVATLLVIAERLKPTQENVDSPSHTLAKILFTKSNSVTPPYTITKDGEKRHISFEGYGIFHTKKLFAKQIIKKVLVVFREVASYENDIKQIKPVGDASIEVSKEVCQSIWIKVPIGSAILEDRNNFREGSSLILMGSQEDDGEAITMIVKEFYLHGTDVHGIEINEFIESMDKLDARQNKNSAEKNIAEVKKYFETTIAID